MSPATLDLPHPASGATTTARRPIAVWLLLCCGAVFAMVVIGGVTRLTGSGLSMVEWRPLIGALPPLSDAEWQRVFALYQASPEYRETNLSMTLAEFRGIFWWEYVHRLWGRLIGALFLLPFLWFLVRGRIDRALAPRLVLLFALGALQGLLGWYMVRSGLVDVPEVSQYRLAAHLTLALAIYAALLWTALEVLWPRPSAVADRRLAGVRRLAWSLVALLAVTVVSGTFMAGTHAGWTYNTLLMDGELVPAGYAIDPWYAAPFENVTAINFNHRVLALATLALALATWWRSRWLALAPRGRRLANVLAAWAGVQVALGIATLLLVVPVALGALHQAGAVVLLTLALAVAFELRAPR